MIDPAMLKLLKIKFQHSPVKFPTANSDSLSFKVPFS
jgi:hypothetical protein